MTVTIRDVARRLNLSITTVSRALDGYEDVAEKTRQRVIETAREMGYAPNRVARQMRHHDPDTIGFILPSNQPRFTDPVFLQMIAGMGDTAARSRLDLMVSTAPAGSEDERDLYQRWVLTQRVDGMVLTNLRLDDWRVDYLAQNDVPFVVSDPVDEGEPFPSVSVDNRVGLRLLVDHLYERGHRRIAFIGGPPDLVMQRERLAGYREAMAVYGLPIDPACIVESDLTRTGGARAAEKLLLRSDPPTAVIGINDPTALGAMRAAEAMGLRIGEELAVTGFYNIPEAETARPALTTLDLPAYEIGCRLVEMLRRLMAGKPIEERRVFLTPELIVRESS